MVDGVSIETFSFHRVRLSFVKSKIFNDEIQCLKLEM